MPPPSFQKSAEKASQISSKIFIEIDSWGVEVTVIVYLSGEQNIKELPQELMTAIACEEIAFELRHCWNRSNSYSA
jgi:hypothetical protein